MSITVAQPIDEVPNNGTFPKCFMRKDVINVNVVKITPRTIIN